MKQRLLPIACASLSLGLLFNWFFFGHNLGLNFFLFTTVLLAITAGFMARWGRPFTRSRLSLPVATIFFAVATFTRASGVVQFLDVVSVLYLLTLIALLVWRPQSRLSDFVSDDYLRRPLRLPALAVAELGRLLRRTAGLNLQSKNAAKRNMMPVIRGILISLPILVIFLVLFASADLVFKQYLTSVFDFHVSPNLVGRTIVFLAVSGFFLGLYSLLFTRSSAQEDALVFSKRLRLGSVEVTVILGSVVSLFLLFVIIQLHYLFGGQSNVTVAGGYTYAQYARKGFFELILVAVIVCLLLLALHAATIRRNAQQHLLFIALCATLVLEVGVIMLSAHYRLSLYEQAYGFTVLRLLSHLFIGWLVVVLALLLIYIVRDQPQKLFARSIFVSAVLFMVLINLLNIGAFVARENIQRYHTTGKIDTSYLGTLSEDATPALSGLLNDPNPLVRKSVAYELYSQRNRYNRSDHSWQAYNMSRQRAVGIRQDHHGQLDANQQFFFLPPQ